MPWDPQMVKTSRFFRARLLPRPWGPSWSNLGHVEHTWGHVGPSWGHVGLSWVRLGPPEGQLGPQGRIRTPNRRPGGSILGQLGDPFGVGLGVREGFNRGDWFSIDLSRKFGRFSIDFCSNFGCKTGCLWGACFVCLRQINVNSQNTRTFENARFP